MGVQRKSIRLLPHEKEFLQQAYLRRKMTIEHYEVRKGGLHALTEEFRSQFGRNESDEEILHYMRTQRKRGLWVRFDGSHQPAPPLPKLPAEHKEILVDIYEELILPLGEGSDAIAYEPEVVSMLATEFEHRTMRRIPGHELIGLLTDLRKRGMLPKVGDQQVQKPRLAGFDDLPKAE